jgi:DNA polymerase elongation subunit (family B)
MMLERSKEWEVRELGLLDEDVYDIEVEDCHNFFANNILVHNSVYINLEPIRVMSGMGQNDILQIAKKVNNFINKSAKQVLEMISAYDTTRMNFKLEKIATRALWTAKKKYAVAVVYDEGVVYNDPSIKVTGLEVVRSSTPTAVRAWIKEALKIILTKDEEDVQKYIADIREKFNSLSVEQVSFPRGVSNVDKYVDDTTLYIKGTPIQVRGSILYNHWIKKKDLTKNNRLIYNGDKVKFTYLKVPNPIRENVIAYPEKLPVEFNLHEYVDYDKQFEASFIKPLENILNSIDWDIEKKQSLEDLFS